MTEILDRVGSAIEHASKERPYGLYDYSNYPGDRPPHVVMYEKNGASVFRSRDAAEARSVYERLCREYIAGAAIEAMREPTTTMIVAAYGHNAGHGEIAEIWRAAIDAALGNTGSSTDIE